MENPSRFLVTLRYIVIVFRIPLKFYQRNEVLIHKYTTLYIYWNESETNLLNALMCVAFV